MTEQQYHKRLRKLTEELALASNARPYDPDAYNAIIDELNKLCQMTIHPGRRRDWIMLVMLICACLILCWIVYDIIFYL